MDLIPYKLPPSKSYRVVILIKNPVIHHHIRENYVKKLNTYGIKDSEILIIGFNPQGGKKDTVGWLTNNVDTVLEKSRCKMLMVCDSKMYEYITGVKSSKGHCSYDVSTIFKYKTNCVPITNYRAINYNTQLAKKLIDGMNSLDIAINSLPKKINIRDVKYAEYPNTYDEIEKALHGLLNEQVLAVDIEAFSLSHLETGIGTISFSKDEDHAVCFCVEYIKLGEKTSAIALRKLLVWFFTNCTAKYLFHRAQYDVKILIFDLFMWRKSDNYAGFVDGANTFKNFEDTMILTYVATNNTTQNVLNLKDNTMEFAGNYAIDIKDITKHNPKVVLEYNAKDTCNTMYLWGKYIDKVTRDQQWTAYKVLRDTVMSLVQADIHGIHISMRKAKSLEKQIRKEIQDIKTEIMSMDCVKSFRLSNTKKANWEYNLKSKTKVKSLPDVLEEYNPNSGTQTADLIHTYLNVEVTDTTKTGLPSMTVDSLTALKNILYPNV
jgi:DNA polymerase-1